MTGLFEHVEMQRRARARQKLLEEEKRELKEGKPKFLWIIGQADFNRLHADGHDMTDFRVAAAVEPYDPKLKFLRELEELNRPTMIEWLRSWRFW